MNSQKEETNLLKTIKHILSQTNLIDNVADMAFEALDDDESGQLDQDEMSKIMREVAMDL